MDAEDERLKLDYEQTLATYRQFTEIRFKLLAFVPTLTGVAVALLTNAELDGLERVALAGLGFFVTFGIVLRRDECQSGHRDCTFESSQVENPEAVVVVIATDALQ